MIRRLLGLFRCQHKNIGFPRTPVGGGQTTVSCHDCKRLFAYDWDRMRIGARIYQANVQPLDKKTGEPLIT